MYSTTKKKKIGNLKFEATLISIASALNESPIYVIFKRITALKERKIKYKRSITANQTIMR